MENFELNTPDDETKKEFKKQLRNDILIGLGIIVGILALTGSRKEKWIGFVFLAVVALVIVGIIYRNMERHKAFQSLKEDLQGLSGNNMDTITEEQKAKWYNDKVKLGLSILIWPVMIYGVYKTSLLKKNTKLILGVVVIVLLILAPNKNAVGGGDSEGKRLVHQSSWDNSVPIVEEYIKKNLERPRKL